MSDIFKFIKAKDNDSFSNMKGIDLQDLLYYMEHYYLKLKSELGFDDDITFGLELEFEKASKDNIKNQMNKYNLSDFWTYKSDESLFFGGEITSPILNDNSNAWDNLSKICSLVSPNAIIGKNSGGHIHVGTQVLGDKKESWLNFIKIWSVYENVIYRFLYGDYLCARTSMMEFAPPVAQDLWSDYKELIKSKQLTIEDIIKKISYKRYQAVNFTNVKKDLNKIEFKNTIEFRCPNGTLNSVIWQNNVNLLINILLYSKSINYDDDLINQRKKINSDKYYSLMWYQEIYLQQALELCDMLFTNNLDKVYFLRQYLKSFEMGKRPLDKTKTFTKV
jgi:hypothetical protein